MRAADHQRAIAVLVGDHHADLVAAQADPRDLTQRLVPQRAGDADRREEIGLPRGLRARRPGADPVAVIGSLLGRGRRRDQAGNDSGHACEREECP
jgi:hypothetical protein